MVGTTLNGMPSAYFKVEGNCWQILWTSAAGTCMVSGVSSLAMGSIFGLVDERSLSGAHDDGLDQDDRLAWNHP